MSYLQTIWNKKKRLTVRDAARAVINEGRCWADVCAEMECIGGYKPGLYYRLSDKLAENRMTFLGLQMAARAEAEREAIAENNAKQPAEAR